MTVLKDVLRIGVMPGSDGKQHGVFAKKSFRKGDLIGRCSVGLGATVIAKAVLKHLPSSTGLWLTAPEDAPQYMSGASYLAVGLAAYRNGAYNDLPTAAREILDYFFASCHCVSPDECQPETALSMLIELKRICPTHKETKETMESLYRRVVAYMFSCSPVHSASSLFNYTSVIPNPLVVTMNHGCVPNVFYYFESLSTMVLVASEDIAEGDECRITYGTAGDEKMCAAIPSDVAFRNFSGPCNCGRCNEKDMGHGHLVRGERHPLIGVFVTRVLKGDASGHIFGLFNMELPGFHQQLELLRCHVLSSRASAIDVNTIIAILQLKLMEASVHGIENLLQCPPVLNLMAACLCRLEYYTATVPMRNTAFELLAYVILTLGYARLSNATNKFQLPMPIDEFFPKMLLLRDLLGYVDFPHTSKQHYYHRDLFPNPQHEMQEVMMARMSSSPGANREPQGRFLLLAAHVMNTVAL